MRMSRQIPRWFPFVILAPALLALAACGPSASPRKAPSTPVVDRTGPKANPKTVVKPVGPATEPAAGKADGEEPAITPAGLIATLEGHFGSSALDLRKEYLGVVEKALGKTLIPGSRLRALVLKTEEGLAGAVIGVLPLDHVFCSEEPAERSRAFWLTPTPNPAKDGLRLVELSTQIFDGSSPELSVPETYPDVPFVELQGTRQCPDPAFGSPGDGPEGQVMEAWALTAEGPKLIRRLESIVVTPAGYSSSTTASLTWIRAEGGAFYLAARRFVTSSTPANSAPGPDDDDSDVIIVRCEAVTWVYKLDAKGQATALTAKQLAPLRKSVAALAALPADGRGNTEDACTELEGP